MKRTDLRVLAILGGLATCLFAVIAVLFAYDTAERRGWLVLAAPAVPTPISIPSATPLRLPPTPRPTSTLAPLATNTLVIPRETINERLLQEIEQKMMVLRNLSPRQAVSKRFLTPDQLREQLKVWYAKENPAAKVYAERQLYLALGFVKETDDLDQILTDLTVRSLAGLYSAEDKQLYIFSDRWNMTAAEEMTFAHEFTHAMQDQYYNLKSLDERAKTKDAHLATLALIEGDASLAMALYAFGNLSQADVDEIAYRAAQLRQDNLVDVPKALTQITLFPYEDGLRFVQALYLKSGGNWDAVNAAFGVPPLSTEQIMHIEKYLSQPDVPVPVALPAMADVMGGSWREIDRGVLGEFLLGLHLEQGLSQAEARKAAAGWGGDSYSLLVDDKGRRLLVMRLVWDTTNDAQKFFRAYSNLIASDPAAQKLIDESGRAYWQSPDKETYVSQHGQDALVILAPDRTTLDRAVYWFPGY